MTEAGLLSLINNFEQDLTLLGAAMKSPGYASLMEEYAKLKSDQFMQHDLCALFKIDPLKLPEMFQTIDQGLLLALNVFNQSPGYVSFLDKLKQHDLALKVLARLLG